MSEVKSLRLKDAPHEVNTAIFQKIYSRISDLQWLDWRETDTPEKAKQIIKEMSENLSTITKYIDWVWECLAEILPNGWGTAIMTVDPDDFKDCTFQTFEEKVKGEKNGKSRLF